MERKHIKIINVVGARPNFVKIAPLIKEMKKYKIIKQILVHTGQHYDFNMSKYFFRDLQLPFPDINLNVGSHSDVYQTAEIIKKFEKVCLKIKPDLIIVVGDVNSTLACSIVGAKLFIPVAHVEAGLRSFDITMPEEINRIITDRLSTFLFTTCKDANKNLKKEGIDEKEVFFVGNVMIDTLISLKSKSRKSKILDKLRLDKKEYAVLTLHRSSNVDDMSTLQRILEALETISKYIPIIFPVHPRTRKQIKKFNLYINSKNIRLIDPLGYLDFLRLYMSSKFILTDSGGIQEEATYLGIPCLTLRENTERPVTIYEGTNELVGTSKKKIISMALKIINNKYKVARIPDLWDGKAAERIVRVLVENFKAT